MIYTRLHGRTGNQMFQYAVARALALRLGVGIVMDERLALHRGENSLTRVFDLPVSQPDKMPPSRHDRPLSYTLWRYLGRNPAYVREAGLGFDPDILSKGPNTYLHGYWQSEKYFADMREQLLEDFAFPKATGRNEELSDEISQTLSVSLHVRRGDYVANASHVVCGQAYYDAALEKLLPELDGEPVIYVFSDEPEWARENLVLPGRKVIVDHNGARHDWEDLRLMSLCRHSIIANSSFSWWAAWLNCFEGQRVMAPGRWFGKDSLQNPDIWAKGWQKIHAH